MLTNGIIKILITTTNRNCPFCAAQQNEPRINPNAHAWFACRLPREVVQYAWEEEAELETDKERMGNGSESEEEGRKLRSREGGESLAG